MAEQTLTLSQAIVEGDLARVKELVNSSNVNSQDEDGVTPLQLAAMNDWPEIAEYLISQGAELNKVPKYNSPLIYAVINESLPMAKLLLDKGANVNNPQGNFASPLHAAVTFWTFFSTEENKIRITTLLLSRGADVAVKNEAGNNVFDQALLDGIESLLDILELYGATVTPDGPAVPKSRFRTPLKVDKRRLLSAAIYCGRLDKVKEVLQEKPAYMNAKNRIGMLPLHEASLSGHMPVIEYLLESGANINQTSTIGATPLSLAIKTGNWDLVAFLRSQGAKDIPNSGGIMHEAAAKGDVATLQNMLSQQQNLVNARDEFRSIPLHYAIVYKQAEAVRLLLSRGALVDAYDFRKRTAIHLAVNSTVEILDMVVNAGATLDLQEENGFSPLFLATALGNLPAVEYLINKGLNPRQREGNMRESLLHMAVRYDHPDIITFLLDNKLADVNEKLSNGMNSLHFATRDNLLDIAELLIARGIDVNAGETELNTTPLHAAANAGSLEMVQLLVEHGADVNIVNRNGNTALIYAQQKGYDDIVEYLKQKGAREASEEEIQEAQKKSNQFVNQVIGEVLQTATLTSEKIDEKLAEDNKPWWKKLFGK